MEQQNKNIQHLIDLRDEIVEAHKSLEKNHKLLDKLYKNISEMIGQ